MTTYQIRLAAGGGNPNAAVDADGFTVTAAGTLTLWDGDPRGSSYGPQTVTHAFSATAWVSVAPFAPAPGQLPAASESPNANPDDHPDDHGGKQQTP